MLQQTRVADGDPVLASAGCAKFPTVRALADAPLDDVLAAWAGLGYYSRARNLHAGREGDRGAPRRAARARAAELREVPGIGPYTAGAIASIAFGERAPLVDGNVARVLARVFAIDDDIKSTARPARDCGSAPASWSPRCPATLAPGDLNQGADGARRDAVHADARRAAWCARSRAPCVRGAPHRPHTTSCRSSRRARRARELPLLAREALWLAAAAARSCSRAARPEGLFGGLWELPQGDRALTSRARSALHASTANRSRITSRRSTHRRLRIAVFRARRAARVLSTRVDPGYDAIARVSLDDRGAARRRSRDDRDPGQVRGRLHGASTPKRSPSSPTATTKILEGIAQLGYDVARRELRRHRGARGEGLPRARSTTRSR